MKQITRYTQWSSYIIIAKALEGSNYGSSLLRHYGRLDSDTSLYRAGTRGCVYNNIIASYVA